MRGFDWTASITDSRKDIDRGFQISEELKRNDRSAEALDLQHELLKLKVTLKKVLPKSMLPVARRWR